MPINYPVRTIPESMPENIITQKIIKCAIEVHKQLGPGLLESVYENALAVEFEIEGLKYRQQATVPVLYKGKSLGEYRLDLMVEDLVIWRSKAWNVLIQFFEAQLLTYLCLTGKRVV